MVYDRKWSLDRLERACRDALLQRSTLKLGKLPPGLAADVWWSLPNGKARVRVDGHKVGLRSGTIHELLHYVLDDSLACFDETLKEHIILAFEQVLDARIAMSPRRVAWWRNAITKRAAKKPTRKT